MNHSADNKRIAKNTIYLYIRMFITMAIGLYTSRIVLQVLGVSDFGLYNIVGGVVTLFSFLNGTLATGTQRFLNFALGTHNNVLSKKTFSTAFNIHLGLAIFIFTIVEVIGVYLLEYKVNIDVGRETAAFWCFQFSAISMLIGILQVPYNATIIAHEQMDFYAYMGIFDSFMKLIIIFCLLMLPNVDKLILYGFLYLCVNVIVLVIYVVYAKRHFLECVVSLGRNKQLYREMLTFSGWNVIGCMASTFSGQGVNLLLNMFYNTVINAAYGITTQVNVFVRRFVNDFQTAATPQIMKLWAEGRNQEMFDLAKNTSKFSAFLIILLEIPLFLEMDYILRLWLGEYPEWASYFTRVIFVQNLWVTMDRPFVMIIHATGQMKWHNLIGGSILLLIVPVTYVLLKSNIDLAIVFAVSTLPWLFEFVSILLIVRHYAKVSIAEYLHEELKSVCVVLLISLPLPIVAHCMLSEGFLRLCSVSALSTIVIGLAVYYLGVDIKTREVVKSKIRERICMQ